MLANWGVLCSYTNGAPLELQGLTVTPLVPFQGVQTLLAFIQPVGVGAATVTIAGVIAYWYCANGAYRMTRNFRGTKFSRTVPVMTICG